MRNSPEKSKEIRRQPVNDSQMISQEIVFSQMHKGPIPPADEFRKYEEVLPGSADRILTMAEKQSAHRQTMENRAISEGIKSSNRGQIFGFIIAILVILLGFWLMMNGKDGYGFSLMIAELVGLVGLFIYNRISEKKELVNKKPQDGDNDNV